MSPITSDNAFLVDAGQACGRDCLYAPKQGYDAPAGLGTPDRIGGF